MTLSLLALAIAPGIAISMYIYFKDKHEKEPLKLLVISFLLGAVSVIPTTILTLIGQYFFDFNPMSSSFYFSLFSCVVGIGLIEEYSKFIFVRYYTYRKEDFNEPFDGIVYCVMVSMGFATVENILYVYEGGQAVAWARMFTAVPMHAIFAIIMGYYMGIQKFYNKKGYAFIGLLYASVLHGVYDFVIMNPEISAEIQWLGFLACIIFGIRVARKSIKLHQDNSPFKVS
ncbi:PrsW family glutamic-type intramembrane protease [Crocinitomicaceae bacterium]|jgi:RsiW-degrading membrane proteinase PrsW (M82 family)|nr:PrsW family glutamic-type intramembrane protease [Crocinitomicaceae bacterium]